jgi:hypothetical protein
MEAQNKLIVDMSPQHGSDRNVIYGEKWHVMVIK